MADGWPGRAGRDNFGQQDMADERLTVDPNRELNAKVMNLLFWQMGALGFCAPKACFLFQAGIENPDVLHFARFAWDGADYDGVETPDFPSYFTATIDGVGTYTFRLDLTVVGRDGNGASLHIQGAFAACVSLADYSEAADNERTNVTVYPTNEEDTVTQVQVSVLTSPVLGTTRDRPVFVVLY